MQSALLPLVISGARNLMILPTRKKGVLNIAAPIMMGTTLIEPSLMGFHKRHPYVTLNIMEAINFVAENSLEDNSIDLTIYNVHKFPEIWIIRY